MALKVLEVRNKEVKINGMATDVEESDTDEQEKPGQMGHSCPIWTSSSTKLGSKRWLTIVGH